MSKTNTLPSQITEHFSYKELTISAEARRKGIDNTPNAEQLANIRYTAEQLEKIRAYLNEKYQRPIGIIVTSCFRNERVNKLVGGSKTSAPIVQVWNLFTMACGF